jgi:hypothetical protein
LYRDLPDSMDQKEVLHYIDELLSASDRQKDDRGEVAEALYELAMRHWHTYEMMPSNYKDRIDEWIAQNW